jgi:hypothetical protein
MSVILDSLAILMVCLLLYVGLIEYT